VESLDSRFLGGRREIDGNIEIGQIFTVWLSSVRGR
jgi:hypothetical protein